MNEKEFKEFMRAKKLRERTIKIYVGHVKKFERYLLKHKRGKELEKGETRRY